MTSHQITYQFGVQHLPRQALRLKRLMAAIQGAAKGSDPNEHLVAISYLYELLNLTKKPELKSRFLQELMRILHVSNKNSSLFSDQWKTTLSEVIHNLSQLAGFFGQELHHDNFIQAISLAASNYHSEGELFAPQLFFWLEGSNQERQHDLLSWIQKFEILQNTIQFYLNSINSTIEFATLMPAQGCYQLSLERQQPCQIIHIRMDRKHALVPKIQLSHHGITIKLHQVKNLKEVIAVDETIDVCACAL